MKRRGTGFTLIEMMVVIGILAILAAILFPVFRSVKAASQRTVCAQNFRSVHQASMLYTGDYDTTLFPSNYKATAPQTSQNDRTWVQLMLTYSKNFSMFRCPSDHSDRPAPETTFDQDLIPGDTYSRFYSASRRSNVGFNFLYLSPTLKVNTTFMPRPRKESEVTSTSSTILFVDSVWAQNGTRPSGGGNYLVAPPCRFYGGQDSFKGSDVGDVYTASFIGWDSVTAAYGGSWPWHDGRMNIIRFDGSLQAVLPARLAEGCTYQSRWGGSIDDPNSYMWDLR